MVHLQHLFLYPLAYFIYYIYLFFLLINKLKKVYKCTQQVLNDELEKYNIVLKSEDRTAICVQSMMVSAALLQAGKEKEYLEWKQQEKELCDY